MESDHVHTRAGKHGALVYVVAIENCARVGQDRATVVDVPGGLVIALADGAGGTGYRTTSRSFCAAARSAPRGVRA